MKHNRQVDVVSLAIPRLLTERCIDSFLTSWADRDQYHVRWIFHLDQYKGLEGNYTENMEMAARLAPRFDDAILLSTKTNVGYGRAYGRALRQVRHDVLNVEDDFFWIAPWSLAAVIKATGQADGRAFFHKQRFPIGTTSPAFWRRHVVEAILERFGSLRDVRDEVAFKKYLGPVMGFRYGAQAGVPGDLWRHVGRDTLDDLGYTENFLGAPVGPRPVIRCPHLGECVGARDSIWGRDYEYQCRKHDVAVVFVNCRQCQKKGTVPR